VVAAILDTDPIVVEFKGVEDVLTAEFAPSQLRHGDNDRDRPWLRENGAAGRVGHLIGEATEVVVLVVAYGVDRAFSALDWLQGRR
jgi:hypothetical protein